MTFTLPDSLAGQLVKQVPARERSRYVAEALADKLTRREPRLIQACEVANNISEIASIERDLDMLQDRIAEPGPGFPAR